MAISKRVAAATFFGKLGLAQALSRLTSHYQNYVRILVYHRVVEKARAYDSANVSATPEQFADQLDYLSKDYDVISFADLLSAYNHNIRLPKRPLLITFDDGFADNYEYAFPALSERNLSAAFFVVTESVGKQELYWFDKIGLLVKTTTEDEWTLLDGSVIKLTDPEVSCQELLGHLKNFPNDKRIEQVRLLEERTLDGTEVLDTINFPMNWDQLREMHGKGMEIFSHTCSHPILSTLDNEADIRRELRDSKSCIEQRLGNDCSVFAYPVGRLNSYDERVLRIVEECGYQFACVNQNGINDLRCLKRYELLRIPVDDFQNAASFRSLVGQPNWFAYK